MRFTRYIGIDYSGAETPESRLKGLQVYEASQTSKPVRMNPPKEGARNWTRLEVAQHCLAAIETGEPVIIGIDHGFSFPLSYMQRYGIETWDQFLDDFMRHWPTADPHTYVDFVRDDNPRTGESSELRDPELSRAAKCAWARLIKNVYEADPMLCPRCGAEMRLMAVIEEAPVVERILRHLGCWDPRPPSQAPPADKDAWPVNGQLPLTYCPLPDIA